MVAEGRYGRADLALRRLEALIPSLAQGSDTESLLLALYGRAVLLRQLGAGTRDSIQACDVLERAGHESQRPIWAATGCALRARVRVDSGDVGGATADLARADNVLATEDLASATGYRLLDSLALVYARLRLHDRADEMRDRIEHMVGGRTTLERAQHWANWAAELASRAMEPLAGGASDPDHDLLQQAVTIATRLDALTEDEVPATLRRGARGVRALAAAYRGRPSEALRLLGQDAFGTVQDLPLVERQIVSLAAMRAHALVGSLATARSLDDAASTPPAALPHLVLEVCRTRERLWLETYAGGDVIPVLHRMTELLVRLGWRGMDLVADTARQALEHQALRTESRTDALTGVGNRRALDEELRQLLRFSALPLALILVDVDHFKEVNDRFTHVVGDEVLRRAAATLALQLRTDDRLLRYGGDEFVVLLPGTGDEEANAVAERMSAAVKARPWGELADGLEVSVTTGCAAVWSLTGRRPDADAEGLFRRADERLLENKRRRPGGLGRSEDGAGDGPAEVEQAPPTGPLELPPAVTRARAARPEPRVVDLRGNGRTEGRPARSQPDPATRPEGGTQAWAETPPARPAAEPADGLGPQLPYLRGEQMSRDEPERRPEPDPLGKPVPTVEPSPRAARSSRGVPQLPFIRELDEPAAPPAPPAPVEQPVAEPSLRRERRARPEPEPPVAFTPELPVAPQPQPRPQLPPAPEPQRFAAPEPQLPPAPEPQRPPAPEPQRAVAPEPQHPAASEAERPARSGTGRAAARRRRAAAEQASVPGASPVTGPVARETGAVPDRGTYGSTTYGGAPYGGGSYGDALLPDAPVAEPARAEPAITEPAQAEPARSEPTRRSRHAAAPPSEPDPVAQQAPATAPAQVPQAPEVPAAEPSLPAAAAPAPAAASAEDSPGGAPMTRSRSRRRRERQARTASDVPAATSGNLPMASLAVPPGPVRRYEIPGDRMPTGPLPVGPPPKGSVFPITPPNGVSLFETPDQPPLAGSTSLFDAPPGAPLPTGPLPVAPIVPMASAPTAPDTGYPSAAGAGSLNTGSLDVQGLAAGGLSASALDTGALSTGSIPAGPSAPVPAAPEQPPAPATPAPAFGAPFEWELLTAERPRTNTGALDLRSPSGPDTGRISAWSGAAIQPSPPPPAALSQPPTGSTSAQPARTAYANEDRARTGSVRANDGGETWAPATPHGLPPAADNLPPTPQVPGSMQYAPAPSTGRQPLGRPAGRPAPQTGRQATQPGTGRQPNQPAARQGGPPTGRQPAQSGTGRQPAQPPTGRQGGPATGRQPRQPVTGRQAVQPGAGGRPGPATGRQPAQPGTGRQPAQSGRPGGPPTGRVPVRPDPATGSVGRAPGAAPRRPARGGPEPKSQPRGVRQPSSSLLPGEPMPYDDAPPPRRGRPAPSPKSPPRGIRQPGEMTVVEPMGHNDDDYDYDPALDDMDSAELAPPSPTGDPRDPLDPSAPQTPPEWPTRSDPPTGRVRRAPGGPQTTRNAIIDLSARKKSRGPRYK